MGKKANFSCAILAFDLRIIQFIMLFDGLVCLVYIQKPYNSRRKAEESAGAKNKEEQE